MKSESSKGEGEDELIGLERRNLSLLDVVHEDEAELNLAALLQMAQHVGCFDTLLWSKNLEQVALYRRWEAESFFFQDNNNVRWLIT